MCACSISTMLWLLRDILPLPWINGYVEQLQSGVLNVPVHHLVECRFCKRYISKGETSRRLSSNTQPMWVCTILCIQTIVVCSWNVSDFCGQHNLAKLSNPKWLLPPLLVLLLAALPQRWYIRWRGTWRTVGTHPSRSPWRQECVSFKTFQTILFHMYLNTAIASSSFEILFSLD